MKRIFCLVFIVGCFTLAGSAQSKAYGKKFDEKKAITMAELSQKMTDKIELSTTVKAKVSSVCQAEGCWMKVDNGNGTTMMVRMKDHKFVLPKNVAGKMAVFTGKATVKTTSVEMLKHYAEDEGKSAAYTATIKEPKTELAFDATGVVIK